MAQPPSSNGVPLPTFAKTEDDDRTSPAFWYNTYCIAKASLLETPKEGKPANDDDFQKFEYLIYAADTHFPTFPHPSTVYTKWQTLHEPTKLVDIVLDVMRLNLATVRDVIRPHHARRLATRIMNLCHVLDVWTYMDVVHEQGVPTPAELKQKAFETLLVVLQDFGRSTAVDEVEGSAWQILNKMLVHSLEACEEVLNSASVFVLPPSFNIFNCDLKSLLNGTQPESSQRFSMDVEDATDVPLFISLTLSVVSEMLSRPMRSNQFLTKVARQAAELASSAYLAFFNSALSHRPAKRTRSMTMAVLSAAKISAAYPMFDCFTKHLVQDLLSRRVKEHEAWSTCDDLLESIVRYPLIAQEDIQLLVKAVSDEAVPWCSSVASVIAAYVEPRRMTIPSPVVQVILEMFLLHEQSDSTTKTVLTLQTILERKQNESDASKALIDRVQSAIAQVVVMEPADSMDIDAPSARPAYARLVMTNMATRLQDQVSSLGTESRLATMKQLRNLIGVLVQEMDKTGDGDQPEVPLFKTISALLVALCEGLEKDNMAAPLELYRLLFEVIRYEDFDWDSAHVLHMTALLEGGMISPFRSVRLTTSRCLAAVFESATRHPKNTQPIISAALSIIERLANTHSPQIRETNLLTMGMIGKYADNESLQRVVSTLFKSLGSANALIRGTACAQISSIAHSRDTVPVRLAMPCMTDLAPYVVSRMVSQRSLLKEVSRVLHWGREAFVANTLSLTLPKLFMDKNQQVVRRIADMLNDGHLPEMLSPHIDKVLAQVYLLPDIIKLESSLAFVLSIYSTGSDLDPDIATILAAHLDKVITVLIIAFGENSSDRQAQVIRAVERIAVSLGDRMRPVTEDQSIVGVVLSMRTRGVVNELVQTLQNARSKHPNSHKVTILHGLNWMISQVGPGFTNVAPQVVACLQALLVDPELRTPVLSTWHTLFTCLRPVDVGPYVAVVSATLVIQWPTFSLSARQEARSILNYIFFEIGPHIGDFMEDFAETNGIKELSNMSTQRQAPAVVTWTRRMQALIRRTYNPNHFVILQALSEMKTILSNSITIMRSALRGDIFNPWIGDLMAALYRTSGREDQDAEPIRLLSYEVLGIVGAVDPDRYEMKNDSRTVLVSYFQTEEEAKAFAIHLMSDMLVDLYRSTNDVGYQGYIIFALQELARFCGFTPAVAEGRQAPVQARRQWKALPKHVLEVLTPLLGAGYVAPPQPVPQPLPIPIYPTQRHYREWLQIWAEHLISKVRGPFSQEVFGAFARVVRQGDAAIAYDLLPSLVLNIIISGGEDEVENLRAELLAVLQDQVDPSTTSSPEKKFLGASAVFVLIDHLSAWVRSARRVQDEAQANRPNRRLQVDERITRIDSVLTSVDEGLMARAALKCRSYALALVNFEKRIAIMREHNITSTQEYEDIYESMHEIYAALDEPDGMQGISTLILSPSLEVQIRQHESTGNWTSAQSCWQLRIQESPSHLDNHIGYLRCLRNIGHYDGLRTHVKGVLTRHPDWEASLAHFNVEGSWMVNDWAAVRSIVDTTSSSSSQVVLARLLLSIQDGDRKAVANAFSEARRSIGDLISKSGVKGHRQSYESLVDLHLVRDLEIIHTADARPNHDSKLFSSLASRLDSTLPTFRNRERILGFRRTAYKLSQTNRWSEDILNSWISTAKMARKAGHWPTAYNAILQSRQTNSLISHIESAKLTRALPSGEAHTALHEITIYMKQHGLIKGDEINMDAGDDRTKKYRAKAVVLQARWMDESGRYDGEYVGKRYGAATSILDSESTWYHLGQYQDGHKDNCADSGRRNRLLLQVVRAYVKAIQLGSKYIYQIVPRLLTIWLDLGQTPEKTTDDLLRSVLREMSGLGQNSVSIRWYIACPQMVSRINHPHSETKKLLSKLIAGVLAEHPKQSLWLFAATIKSKDKDRAACGKETLDKIRNPTNPNSDLPQLINESEAMTSALLDLCDHPVKEGKVWLSMRKDFPRLHKMLPSKLIIPLQESLTAYIPIHIVTRDHQPFPTEAPFFQDWDDEIEVMRSLAKPRKVSLMGSNGRKYIFLGKPKDDLRKDARLMDFNGIINKLLKSTSDSRRRRLHIRTYGVVTLNEECGFVQWVPNTKPIRGLLNDYYSARGIPAWRQDMMQHFEKGKHSPKDAGHLFITKILPSYPAIFHRWFLDTFPEPSAWFASRLAFARTAAVMSMVGYILGLGDRHLENILIDQNSADVVHVDFNCLFDKGHQLETPERVPFRLTQNIVDGMGVTGPEGAFRVACEISMKLLRENKDTLRSVLDAFVHDPLVEWQDERRKQENRQRRGRGAAGVHPTDNKLVANADLIKLALHALAPIEKKLQGFHPSSRDKECTTNHLVHILIQEATDPRNLGRMYPGWAPWH